MKILWLIFIIWTVDNAPLMKPFDDECKRVGGFIEVQRMSEFVLGVRCSKLEIKDKFDENKEPERIPNTYSTG